MPHSMRRGVSLNGQDGFTLVELMVAALVLVVGMLAILGVLSMGVKKTSLNRQRTSATNLAREITEAARASTYAQLNAPNLKAELQSTSTSLTSLSSPTWTIKRTNTVFTVDVSSCAFDDPADGIATLAPDEKCTNGTTTTVVDPNGDDFRRLTVKVNWKDQRNKVNTFQQTALISNPAGGIGPRIITFPAATNVGPGTNVAHFNLTTSNAGAIHWNADDGVSEGDATRSGAGYTAWGIDWALKPVNATGAVLDGTYTVTAQALDDLGIAGDSKVSTVTINRSLPAAPTGFLGGHDTRAGDWVDLEWFLNSERDIIGYRVFDAGADDTPATADDRRVCPPAASPTDRLANNISTCTDFTPRSGSVKYFVYAIDSTTPSPIGARSVLSVGAPNARPTSPTGLVVTSGSTPQLTWSAPVSGSVAFYRVYRDGIAVADRLAKTGPSDLAFTDLGSNNTAHDYYVTAVDSKYNESDPLGPVRG